MHFGRHQREREKRNHEILSLNLGLNYILDIRLVTYRIRTRNLGIGFWKMPHGEICLRQVEQGFSSFFVKFFGIFDDFSKWETLKKFGLVQLAFNSLFRLIRASTRKFDFGYIPDLSL